MMQGIGLEDLLKMLAGMSSGDEREEVEETQEENTEDLGAYPRIKGVCRMFLNWKRKKIVEKEQRIAALHAERDEEIQEHNDLVDELIQLDSKSAQNPVATNATPPVESEGAGDTQSPGTPVPEPTESPSNNTDVPAEPQPEVPQELDGNGPAEPAIVPKRRGRQAQFSPNFKRLSMHKPTGNPRLDALDTALHDALERMNNSKMAFHFMAIKEVRMALTDLYKGWDKPEAERIAELETGLKEAVDKLSANPNAANTKIMPEIWGDIIVALQGDKNENQ